MARLSDVSVDALELIDHVTVSVRVYNVWRLRLGLRLIALAARVMRCRIDVETVTVGDTHPIPPGGS